MEKINLDGGSYSFVEIPAFVKVGNYSSIADGVYFHTGHDNHLCVSNRKCVYTTNWDQHEDKSETIIGSDVWIGREAKIMYGVHIGHGAIVGAYTVVTKDVPPFAVVVGNPHHITRFRFTASQMKKLLKLKWWDRQGMQEHAKEMQDIKEFLKNEQ